MAYEDPNAELQKLRAEVTALRPHKQLLDALGSDGRTRRKVLDLVKEKWPQVNVPEIDATKPLEEKIGALEKTVTELRTSRTKEDEDRRIEEEKRKADSHFASGHKLLKKAGFNADGIKEIEQFMVDRGLVDYEAALALWEKSHPKDEPFMPADAGRDLNLFQPPKENPWAEAVKAPTSRIAETLARRAQNTEINNWFRENRGGRRVA